MLHLMDNFAELKEKHRVQLNERRTILRLEGLSTITVDYNSINPSMNGMLC